MVDNAYLLRRRGAFGVAVNFPFSMKYIELLPTKALLCQVYIPIQFKFHTKDCIIYPFNKHNCESWGSNVVQRPARRCIRFPSSFN
ncbi:hypothetical protein ALC57_08162 [Trachymyrmex cornetzi]|uniref:Uncharacterized protein n=1 Tax=Trachymyrmex cornetzi TaxID=471704 RepID=A0A195E3P1_9HYME|nr:hypothetical protein ALC57_08162 [Trachymyrmex cornetzi]